MGFKGNLVSATAPAISLSGASGIWKASDQLQAKQNDTWPHLIASYLVNYLVVAGGGSGVLFGGGGAGGVTTNSFSLVSGTTYTITIGGAGAQGGDSAGVGGSAGIGGIGISSTISGSSTYYAGGGGGGGDARGGGVYGNYGGSGGVS